MASHRTQIYRAAQKIVRPDPSTTPWTPPVSPISFSQGRITGVNLPNGHADFQFPHPTGDGVIAQGVPYIHAYTAASPATEGDLAWAVHIGSLMLLLGAQQNPTNVITL